jgi:hypothetical protein
MLAKRTTVPVTMKALMARINRKLEEDGAILKAARGDRIAASFGRFFIVSGDKVTAQRVAPEQLARKLGVLADWEHLETKD